MKTGQLIITALIGCSAILVADAHNEKMTVVYFVFIGVLFVVYGIPIVMDCLKDTDLTQNLILFVAGGLLWIALLFVFPYVWR